MPSSELSAACLQETGREPTIDEVAKCAEMSPERVREILRISQDTISLEQPLGEDDFNLSDILEDEGALAPSDAAARAMLAEAVRNVLADLSERERKVVCLRFGLEDGQARTLEEVGKDFGVTRERVRQIESKEPRQTAPTPSQRAIARLPRQLGRSQYDAAGASGGSVARSFPG